MPDYKQGKIYFIICNTTGLKYIGSTTLKYVSQRLQKHLSNYKEFLKGNANYTTSFKLLENNNYEIVLIENYLCNSKDELHARERIHIENNVCVNRNIPTRTKKEWDEVNKEKRADNMKAYYEANKEKILDNIKSYKEANKIKIVDYQKAYYEANKEINADYTKAYREANKEKKTNYNKAYYEANKEKLADKNKLYYEANKKPKEYLSSK